MPLHNRWSNVECLLAEGEAEQQEKLCHAWMEGFSVIIRIPQRGSVCIFIYIYISFMFGTGADRSILHHICIVYVLIQYHWS